MRTLILIILIAIFIPINRDSLFAQSGKFTNPDSNRVKQIEITMNQIELQLKELEMLNDKLQTQKNSLSEMTDEDKLKLQYVMDRKSKIESTLSDILKKFSQTSSGINQNIK